MSSDDQRHRGRALGPWRVGVGEVGAAVKAGEIGIKVLVTTDRTTMLAVGDATVTAAAGAAKVAYGTTSLATSLTQKDGTSGDCQCSKVGESPSKLERYDGATTNYHLNKAHVKWSKYRKYRRRQPRFEGWVRCPPKVGDDDSARTPSPSWSRSPPQSWQPRPHQDLQQRIAEGRCIM